MPQAWATQVPVGHSFRFNCRDTAKAERANTLLGQIEGPLPYKVLIA